MKGNRVKSVISSVIIAGIILFAIGFYLAAIKGGIPYQDPTAQMQIKWQAYHMAGEWNMTAGLVLTICGVLAKIVEKSVEK
ncbi:MAG: hypothetical protein IJ435_07890 [Clostridia bacterium]|nr:hypothetical protein [Clostridia bacterium]